MADTTAVGGSVARRSGARSRAASKRGSQPTSETARGPADLAGGRFVLSFLDDEGEVRIERVTERLALSETQLAETAGFDRDNVVGDARSDRQRLQARLGEMLEILGRIADWAGGERQALAWYRAEPLPSFGGRTAEALVKQGQAAAVRNYLDRVAVGGFA